MARIALLQFRVGESKPDNFKKASEYLSKASDGNAKLCVLPEIWNSPYATSAFPEYAEILPEVGDNLSTCKEDSISAKFLIEQAIQHKMIIVGGSIPEKNNRWKNL